MQKKLSIVDLFAGVGGLSVGFLNARNPRFAFETRLMADVDPTAIYTFKKNFPRVPFWRADLSKVSGSEITKLSKMPDGKLDVLVGGPPCQGFSPSGKRWLNDARNQLLARFVQFAHEIKPKCVIIENVPTALSSWEKLFDQEIQEALDGYVAKVAVLNASSFGVPQIRKRAFIVGFRKDLGVSKFDFPTGAFDAVYNGKRPHIESSNRLRFVSVAEAIEDLPPLNAGRVVDGLPYLSPPTSHYQSERREGSIAIFNHVARSHSKAFLSKISVIRPGQSNATLPKSQRFSDNYFSQAYARLQPCGIGLTVTANFRNPGSGCFTHYRDDRSITVREAARLQSFDDRFIFYGYDSDQERHVGNAVPPLLAKALAEHFGEIIANA